MAGGDLLRAQVGAWRAFRVRFEKEGGQGTAARNHQHARRQQGGGTTDVVDGLCKRGR